MHRLGPLAFLLACTPSASHEGQSAVEVEPVVPEPTSAAAPIVAVAETPPASVAVGPRVSRPMPELEMARPRRDLGWTIDIIDNDPALMGAAIKASDAASEAAPNDEGEPLMLPEDSAAIPKGWKVGDTWTLVTRDGVLRRRVRGFMVSSGASEAHFEVVLAGAKTPATRSVLAIRGTDVPDDLRFTKPPARDLAVLGDDPIEAVRKAIVDDGNAETRELFATARIATKHIHVYDGAFPGGRTQLVVLDAPPARAQAKEFATRASALLMRHADGHLELVATAGVEGWIGVNAIIDVDGDGYDEVFYDDSYYEGGYDMAIQWKADAPQITALSGDGA